MFEQITKSYRSEVRTYTTDKLMFGCKEKLKLHLLNKYKKEKKEKRNLIEKKTKRLKKTKQKQTNKQNETRKTLHTF